MSKNDRQKRRTPSELLVIAQQRVAALELAAAQSSESNHPAMQELINLDLALAKQTALLIRNFTKGPQSLEYRLAKHKAWCDEISASYDYSMALVLDNGLKRSAIANSIRNEMKDAIESRIELDISFELERIQNLAYKTQPSIAELSIKLTKCIQARIALNNPKEAEALA